LVDALGVHVDLDVSAGSLDRTDQPDSTGMGELLCGGACESVLFVCQRLGRKEDPAGRLWLVDWEAAFQNDRYADLAVVANMIVTNESEETDYLQEYFGKSPDEYQRARFYLMRQLAHMFYAMAFLAPGVSSEPIDQGGPVPEYSDYQQSFSAREVSLSDNHSKTLYGRVHWERLAQNMRQPRFKEALKLSTRR